MYAYFLCQLYPVIQLCQLSLIFSLLCFDTGDSDGGVTFILNYAPFI